MKQDIHVRTPEDSQNWHMMKDGSRVKVAGFADQPTKPATLLRGDIEERLWHAIDGQIEVRFAPPSRRRRGRQGACPAASC